MNCSIPAVLERVSDQTNEAAGRSGPNWRDAQARGWGDLRCGPFKLLAAGSSTPRKNLDQMGDLWISRGRILPMGGGYEEAEIVIDAHGMIVCPGLIDVHVHLREPGNEEDETIATGASCRLGERCDVGGVHAQHPARDRFAGNR